MTVLENVTQMRLPLEVAELVEEKETNKDLNKNQLLMKKILDEILSLGYYSGKKLEKAVEEILIANGVKYKSQPNGSQKFPDFHVYFNDKEFNIECKSNKGTKITWNQSYPRDNSLYVFSTSTKKYMGTHLFMGQDHWRKEVKDYFLNKVLTRVKKQQDRENKKAKSKFGDDVDLSYYCRQMWEDKKSPIDNRIEKLKNVYDYFNKELK